MCNHIFGHGNGNKMCITSTMPHAALAYKIIQRNKLKHAKCINHRSKEKNNVTGTQHKNC